MNGGCRSSAGILGALAVAALLTLLAVMAAACTPAGSVGPSSIPTIGPGGVGPPVTLEPGSTPLVRIDTSLLGVLPAEVDGLSVLESSEAEADEQANGSLASLSDGVSGALAIDPATADFVLVDVVRLRPAALDDAKFRSWRDSFDAGVCLDTGVIGHAQSAISGRTVYIGTCGNGFRTYQTWIKDKNLLISASAGGTRKLGELLFQGLRP